MRIWPRIGHIKPRCQEVHSCPVQRCQLVKAGIPCFGEDRERYDYSLLSFLSILPGIWERVAHEIITLLFAIGIKEENILIKHLQFLNQILIGTLKFFDVKYCLSSQEDVSSVKIFFINIHVSFTSFSQ